MLCVTFTCFPLDSVSSISIKSINQSPLEHIERWAFSGLWLGLSRGSSVLTAVEILQYVVVN